MVNISLTILKKYKSINKQINKTIKTQQKYKLATDLRQIYLKHRLNSSLKTYAIRYKPTTTEITSAFKSYTNAYSISNIKLTGLKGLSYLKYQYNKLNRFLSIHPNMKILIVVDLILDEGDEDEVIRQVQSRRYDIYNSDDLKNSLNNMAKDIEIQIETKQFHKSGLVIRGIDKITIQYDRYNPTRGGSYIELPEWIANKKACINIKNKDNKCFKYSVQCGVLGLHHKVNPERESHYTKINDNICNWDMMKYPAGNSDIDRFEEINKGLVSVNVYAELTHFDKSTIVLHKRTKTVNAKHHVNLLKIEDEAGKSHYVFIKNYDKLIGSQTNGGTNKLFHCRYCQHGFKRQNLLDKHLERGCLAVEGQSVKMPDEGSEIVFKNHYRKFKCPFTIYADFECLTMETGNFEPVNQHNSYTQKYQKHSPSGFKLNVVDSISETSDAYTYRGVDCMDVFCDKIKEIENKLMKILTTNKEIEMTCDDITNFNNATHCYLCSGEITDDDKKEGKVRDHCHITGKYRGCAHNVCNINYNHKNIKIPVFFHNLKNYDAHLIISHAHKMKCKKKIDVIAQNSEKIISFGFDHLIFKDSFGFLTSSLDKLVKLNKYKEIDGVDVLLENWQNNFKFSKQNDYIKNNHDLHLLTDKGVYPYDYMNSWDKFDETELPPKEAFFSKLSNEHISDADYERAKNIWNHFEIKTMGEYHDLYLKTDVLLLTDVFENFRNMCLEYYELDPAHYYTLPNFGWDAMLLKTGVNLELIHDLEMYEMVEKGLRGGMCQVSKKHVTANNKYMKNYDTDVISSYINYLDANNLYGLAMSHKLPYGELQWSDDIYDTDDISNYKDGDDGYILEVDLEYPETLHDLHSDYPLAPENMSVSADMVSDFSKTIYGEYHNGKQVTDEKGKKLILNVMDKTCYVVHIRNLKYYLEMGLKLKQIHRTIKFKQSEWLKPWIDFNTTKRKQSTNEFYKDLFKLMNNAVFGKTMEDVRSHQEFELVDNIVRLEKCLNNPTLKNRHIINDSLVGVEKIKQVVKLNKPIYIGMAILDLSKLHMYEFFYGVLKPKYGDRIKLAYTDTDSFVTHIETDDVFKDFREIGENMDFSDYPVDHPNHSTANKKRIGKFKDEVNGKIISEFIGLKPKMYAMQMDDGIDYKKAKGVPKNIVKKHINFNMYKKTLNENTKSNVQFQAIRSYNHQLYSITCSKSGLSNFENKRYYVSNDESYPHGHYRIK